MGGQGKGHGQRQLGYGIGGIARYIAHGDAALCAIIKINIVIARSRNADLLQMGRCAQIAPVQLQFVGDQHIRILNPLRQLIRSRHFISGDRSGTLERSQIHIAAQAAIVKQYDIHIGTSPYIGFSNTLTGIVV